MSSFITDPIINNRICKIIPSTVSLLSSLITNHPIPLSFPLQAVTLHDYLSFLRTFHLPRHGSDFIWLSPLTMINFFNLYDRNRIRHPLYLAPVSFGTAKVRTFFVYANFIFYF